MKHVVGVADMKVSGTAGDVIITHALGSCLGIVIHDKEAGVGGMVHVMLPLSTMDAAKAAQNPWMFVDSGVTGLFKECYKLGAVKHRIAVVAAGGATLHEKEEDDFFQIGKRNIVVLRKLLWKNGVGLGAHDLGGNLSRTMYMEIGSGDVTVKASGMTRRF